MSQILVWIADIPRGEASSTRPAWQRNLAQKAHRRSTQGPSHATVAASSSMFPGGFDPKNPYGALLSDPSVLALLTKRLESYSLPAAEAQDIVSAALEALWRRRDDEDRPDNLARVLGLASTVVEGKVNDYFRRKGVREMRIVDGARLQGPDADPPAERPQEQPNYVDEIAALRSMTPEDSLAAKEKLSFVNAQVNKGVLTEDDIEVMQAQQSGEETLEELAQVRGVPAGTLRSRLHRLRKKLALAWAEYSLITKTSTIVFLILLFLVVVTVIAAALRRREPPPPLPPPPPAPTPTQVQPAPTAPAPPLLPNRPQDKESK
jgi:RNA polymerase sigma factor (sigma-70 family)